jgi:crossover junction endodeoxyribonuclease RuvC
VRVVGIDPGLTLTGYACVESRNGAGEPALVEAGVFRLKSRMPMPYRLGQLHEDLSTLLDERRPDLMAIEKIFAQYRHPNTPILMGHARGVILLAAQERSIPIDEVSATLVKKALTGNGHATKRQMQLAVMAQCRLAEPPSPPDVADAIAIALCVARRRAIAH